MSLCLPIILACISSYNRSVRVILSGHKQDRMSLPYLLWLVCHRALSTFRTATFEGCSSVISGRQALVHSLKASQSSCTTTLTHLRTNAHASDCQLISAPGHKVSARRQEVAMLTTCCGRISSHACRSDTAGMRCNRWCHLTGGGFRRCRLIAHPSDMLRCKVSDAATQKCWDWPSRSW